MKLKEFFEITDNDNYIFLYDEDNSLYDGYISELKKRFEKKDYRELLNTDITKINPCNNGELDIYIKIPFIEKKWIKEMVNKFINDPELEYATIDNVIFVINKKYPGKSFGWAKCAEKDNYSWNKGVAIAYARYSHYNIPKEL